MSRLHVIRSQTQKYKSIKDKLGEKYYSLDTQAKKKGRVRKKASRTGDINAGRYHVSHPHDGSVAW